MGTACAVENLDLSLFSTPRVSVLLIAELIKQYLSILIDPQ